VDPATRKGAVTNENQNHLQLSPHPLFTAGGVRHMKNIIFYLGMGTLFTHELDAVAHHEWRIFPLIRLLPENLALNVFVLAHVPLFAVAIATVASSNLKAQKVAKVSIAAFFIVHAVLHALFTGHPQYEFFSFTSLTLIFGGAILGGAYLAIEFWPETPNVR
jgi:hypothetical protein